MKKRILFISNLYPNPLSPNRATFNRQQITALRKFYDIDVVSPIAWSELVGKRRFPRMLRSAEPDVYHPVYWYPPGCLRTMYGESYYHSINVLAHELLERNRYDLIYAAWLYPDGWAAARLAEEYRLQLFVKVVGTDVNRLVSGSPLAVKSLEVTRTAQKVVCVSRALQNRLLALGCEPDKPVVVHNGVDREIFRYRPRLEARRELGIDPDEKLILFVGNLIKEKGLQELVAAFGMLESSGVRLAIIGAGAFEAELRQLIAGLPHPEKVHIVGSQPLARVALWMNAASLLCLPSYMEGLPNVVIEALSSGIPVIATRVGGIPEIDRGDGSLTLIEPCTVGPLATALTDVLRRDQFPVHNSFIPTWCNVAEQLTDIFSAKT